MSGSCVAQQSQQKTVGRACNIWSEVNAAMPTLLAHSRMYILLFVCVTLVLRLHSFAIINYFGVQTSITTLKSKYISALSICGWHRRPLTSTDTLKLGLCWTQY